MIRKVKDFLLDFFLFAVIHYLEINNESTAYMIETTYIFTSQSVATEEYTGEIHCFLRYCNFGDFVFAGNKSGVYEELHERKAKGITHIPRTYLISAIINFFFLLFASMQISMFL